MIWSLEHVLGTETQDLLLEQKLLVLVLGALDSSSEKTVLLDLLAEHDSDLIDLWTEEDNVSLIM